MQASAQTQSGISPAAPSSPAKSMPLSKALNSYRSVLQTLWFLADPQYCDLAVEDTDTVCADCIELCLSVCIRGTKGGEK